MIEDELNKLSPLPFKPSLEEIKVRSNQLEYLSERIKHIKKRLVVEREYLYGICPHINISHYKEIDGSGGSTCRDCGEVR